MTPKDFSLYMRDWSTKQCRQRCNTFSKIILLIAWALLRRVEEMDEAQLNYNYCLSTQKSIKNSIKEMLSHETAHILNIICML